MERLQLQRVVVHNWICVETAKGGHEGDTDAQAGCGLGLRPPHQRSLPSPHHATRLALPSRMAGNLVRFDSCAVIGKTLLREGNSCLFVCQPTVCGQVQTRLCGEGARAWMCVRVRSCGRGGAQWAGVVDAVVFGGKSVVVRDCQAHARLFLSHPTDVGTSSYGRLSHAPLDFEKNKVQLSATPTKSISTFWGPHNTSFREFRALTRAHAHASCTPSCA
jgi:hypothetical protein